MKILYFNLGMGAAGDMLTAALYELLSDADKQKALEAFKAFNIPGVSFVPERSEKCGIVGTHMNVIINGIEEDESIFTGNASAGGNAGKTEEKHAGKAGEEAETAADNSSPQKSLSLPDNVRAHFREVYKLIGKAESKAHGVPVKQVHFHEVAEADAVADISAVCFLMEMIKPDLVVASPINVGSGQVRCMHGIVPVPAPATANILKGVPIYSNGISGELCTPTGAALIRHFADSFGNLPEMKVSKIGYGMGKKDFEAANCVVAMLGESV